MTRSGSQTAPFARGRAEVFRADQLVVSLAHSDLVLGELKRHAGRADDVVRRGADERLGLALLELPADAVVASLRSTHPDEVDRAWAQGREALSAGSAGSAAGASGGPEIEPSSLDVAVRVLRRTFARRYAGWAPTMGKNRIVGHVTGSYVIDGGRPPTRSDYVIDGGGLGGPVRAWGDYVIDGGGSGAPGRVYADYVIDGGGEPRPAAAASHVIGRRERSPGAGVRVGVVDTRLYAHPWLAGGYVAAADDLMPARLAPDLPPAAGHATFITGMVLRQAPGAVVELHAGLEDNGSADSWSVAQTITRLAGAGTQVINLSLGCYTDDGQAPLVLAAALASLGPETIVVAAAGNHGQPQDGVDGRPASRPVWPAAFDNVLAVGAVDGEEELAPFTPRVPWIDAVAPGVDVVSTYLPEGGEQGSPSEQASFASWSGTSFAAAAVSGALAARIADTAGTPRQAWLDLQRDVKRDSRELPIVPLRVLKHWPSDGP